MNWMRVSDREYYCKPTTECTITIRKQTNGWLIIHDNGIIQVAGLERSRTKVEDVQQRAIAQWKMLSFAHNYGTEGTLTRQK